MTAISKPKLRSLYRKHDTPLPVQKRIDRSLPCVLEVFGRYADNDSVVEAFEDKKGKEYSAWSRDQKELVGEIRTIERESERESRSPTKEEEANLAELRETHATLVGLGQEIRAKKAPRLISTAALLSVFVKNTGTPKEVPINAGANPKKAFNESVALIIKLTEERRKVMSSPLTKEEAMAAIIRTVETKAAQGRVDFGRAAKYVKMNLDGAEPEWRRQLGIDLPQKIIPTPIGSTYVDDSNNFVLWLLKDLFLERASAELDRVLPSNTLTIAARTRKAAELDAAILQAHRVAAAAMHACEDQGITFELPEGLELHPLAILGIEFVTAKKAKDSDSEDLADFG